MFQSCFLSAHGYAGPTTTKYKVITVAWASSYVSSDPPENAVDNIDMQWTADHSSPTHPTPDPG